jgi:hypothetical protein
MMGPQFRKIAVETMLAYVFWHSAAPAVLAEEYMDRLQAFHTQLNETPPPGLLSSHTWRVDGAPWLDDVNGFEDWYLVEDTSKLDALAEAAVSRHLRSVHDAVAHLAAAGTAGLYKPARETRAQVDGSVVTWFSKPAGQSYDELYTRLDEQDPSIAGRLWQRFLTLGPGPEFCAVGDEPVELPVACVPCRVYRYQ